MTDKAEKHDHITPYVPPHMDIDTPAWRTAIRASAKTDTAKEAPEALAEAVRESKRELPKKAKK